MVIVTLGLIMFILVLAHSLIHSFQTMVTVTLGLIMFILVLAHGSI